MAVSLSFPHIKLPHDPPHGNRERRDEYGSSDVAWRHSVGGAKRKHVFYAMAKVGRLSCRFGVKVAVIGSVIIQM